MFWRSLSDEIANYVGVLIFGVLAAPTIQGQAVFGEEKFTVSPFVGATGHDEIEAGPGIDLLTRSAFGVRVGEDLWRKFGFEQTFSWNPTNLKFLSNVTTAGARAELDAKSFRFSFDDTLETRDVAPLGYPR